MLSGSIAKVGWYAFELKFLEFGRSLAIFIGSPLFIAFRNACGTWPVVGTAGNAVVGSTAISSSESEDDSDVLAAASSDAKGTLSTSVSLFFDFFDLFFALLPLGALLFFVWKKQKNLQKDGL